MNSKHLILEKLQKVHTLYIATILFLFAFFVYGNTFGNQLFFDDEDFVYKNIYVQNFEVHKFFTENLIAGTSKLSNYYRPLLLITYSLEYNLFSNLSFVYHFDNMLLHAACGVLLFIILRKIFNNTFISFITSSLFIIHPLQTEAVSYVSGRGDSLSVFFIFLTILFYVRKPYKPNIISVACFIFALLSKETAIVTPALIFIIDYVKCHSMKQSLKKIIPFFVIGVGYMLLRLTVLNFQNTLNFYGTENMYTSHVQHRILTFLSILPTYVGLLVFPKVLYIDRAIDIVTHFRFDILIIFLCLLFLCFLFYKLYRKYPIFLFSFLWFFITISPMSGIIPINGVLYEHFLYLPSVGFFLIISYLLFLGITRLSSVVSFFLLIIIFLIFCGLSARTIIRNNEWNNPITFYTQTIEHNPTSSRLYNNLAMSFADQKLHTLAIQNYKKAIQVGDFYPQTHYNLANSYIAINQFDEAEKEYKKAITIDPSFSQAYVSLARMYKSMDRKDMLNELLRKLSLVSKTNQNFLLLFQYVESLIH